MSSTQDWIAYSNGEYDNTKIKGARGYVEPCEGAPNEEQECDTLPVSGIHNLRCWDVLTRTYLLCHCSPAADRC